MDHLSPVVRTALDTDLTIDITTTGRRSGMPRRIEIWFLNVAGRIYIAGTPGPRDWLANLRATPEFVFHLKESIHADLPARATEVTSLDERRSLFEHAVTVWYRDQSDVDGLVAAAPVVRVEFLEA